jgi:hypothetical protein
MSLDGKVWMKGWSLRLLFLLFQKFNGNDNAKTLESTSLARMRRG